jgi:hypothetical protein
MTKHLDFDALEPRIVCDGAPVTIEDLSPILGLPPSQIGGQPSPPHTHQRVMLHRGRP